MVLVWICLSILLIELPQPFWPSFLLVWCYTLTTHTSKLLQAQLAPSPLVYFGKAQVALLSIGVLYGSWALVAVQNKQDIILEDASLTELPEKSELSTHDETTGIDDDSDNSEGRDSDNEEDHRQAQQRRVQEQGGWIPYLKSLSPLLAWVLPYKPGPARNWFAMMMACSMAQRALVVLIPRQMGIVVDKLSTSFSPEQLPMRDFAIYLLLHFPLQFGVDWAKSTSDSKLRAILSGDLKIAAFGHIMDLSMDYHCKKSTGTVMRAMEYGAELMYTVENVLSAAFSLVDVVIGLWYFSTVIDDTLPYIILITAILSTYLLAVRRRFTNHLKGNMSEMERQESTALYDITTNWFTVATNNREAYEKERYARLLRDASKTSTNYGAYCNLVYSFQDMILRLGLFLGLYVAVSRAADGPAAVSSIVFITNYWENITGPISMVSYVVSSASRDVVSADWLQQLLATKPSIQDATDATDLAASQGKVEFRNVSFGYDANREILKDVNFTAEAGQSIALVGETGSGKSTILNLLFRFYDVGSGSVVIDGQDVRDVHVCSLRSALGIVPQDPSVLDQTIMQNVRYARLDASDDEVHEACKKARLHDQIMTFPEAYDTRIGERGVRLSGGELQRLAIARVILREPRIVVLDEATSAIDSDTEAAVQEALRMLSTGRTVFTVAHRLSTIIHADVILVVDKGRIIERGTHAELVNSGGKYAALWAKQTSSS